MMTLAALQFLVTLPRTNKYLQVVEEKKIHKQHKYECRINCFGTNDVKWPRQVKVVTPKFSGPIISKMAGETRLQIQ